MPRFDAQSALAAFCLGFVLTGMVLLCTSRTARASEAQHALGRKKRPHIDSSKTAHTAAKQESGGAAMPQLPERFLAFDVSRPFGSRRTSFKAAVWDRFCRESLDTGRRMVVVQARGSKTSNPYADLLLQGARRNGLRTAAYLFLSFYHGQPAGDQQVSEALEAVGSEASHLDFLVVDVENGAAGGMSTAERVNRIGQAVEAVGKAGLRPVIYAKNTGGHSGEWTDLTGNSEDFSYLPLWVPRYDSIPSIENDGGRGEWTPFGGWSARHGKQFSDDRLTVTPSGLPADESIFSRAVLDGPRETRTYRVTPMVQVVAGPAKRRKGSDAIIQPVKLINRSNSSIMGPLSVLLSGLTDKVSLTNRHGNSQEAGTPFVQIDSKRLDPGASLRTELHFTGVAGPRYQVEVRAGTGKV